MNRVNGEIVSHRMWIQPMVELKPGYYYFEVTNKLVGSEESNDRFEIYNKFRQIRSNTNYFPVLYNGALSPFIFENVEYFDTELIPIEMYHRAIQDRASIQKVARPVGSFKSQVASILLPPLSKNEEWADAPVLDREHDFYFDTEPWSKAHT